MTNWFNLNKKSIIRGAFLIPIFLVAAISISHVVRWYSLANPISWAIYLSIAIEVAAMSAIAASSVKVKGFSVWFVFIIVTLIQFIGNIFFCYTEIDETSQNFKDWSELSAPLFEMLGTEELTVPSQKRWLAILEGGLLPLISLTCLHFFIKYGDIAPIESTAVLNNHDESDKISEVDLVDEADVSESNDIVSEEINHIQEEAVELTEPNIIKTEVTSPIESPTQVKTPQNTRKFSKYGISEKMKKIIKSK